MTLQKRLHLCCAAAADLEAYVRQRLGTRVRSLRLEFVTGGVVLHGRSATFYAKQLAQHAVMEMTDIRIQDNAIEVVGSATEEYPLGRVVEPRLDWARNPEGQVATDEELKAVRLVVKGES